MNHDAHTAPTTALLATGLKLSEVNWEKVAVLYARIALGTAFLSAVAARFGLWHGRFDPSHFSVFLQYAREVLAFMPPASVPYLAGAATICETSLGILLILGLWPRWVSLASTGLLAMFATSMAISQGLKEPLDYSVFSASSAAALLALHAFRAQRGRTCQSPEPKLRH